MTWWLHPAHFLLHHSTLIADCHVTRQFLLFPAGRPVVTGRRAQVKGRGQTQPRKKIRFPFRAPVERLSYLVAVPGKRRSTSERPLLLSRQWRAIAPRERL